jgi:membrane protein DedA with SNARE-associated domain
MARNPLSLHLIVRSVEGPLAFLAHWGYVILAAVVVAEQIRLPVPAVPALLSVGALAADGRKSIVVALAVACAAAVPSSSSRRPLERGVCSRAWRRAS